MVSGHVRERFGASLGVFCSAKGGGSGPAGAFLKHYCHPAESVCGSRQHFPVLSQEGPGCRASLVQEAQQGVTRQASGTRGGQEEAQIEGFAGPPGAVVAPEVLRAAPYPARGSEEARAVQCMAAIFEEEGWLAGIVCLEACSSPQGSGMWVNCQDCRVHLPSEQQRTESAHLDFVFPNIESPPPLPTE